MAKVDSELTPLQKEVLDLMWEIPVAAKVGRRFTNEDGSFRFDHINRLTHPIDFALDGEFVLKLHEKNPDAPLSPYYINLRNMPDNLLTKVAEAIAEATQDFNADYCTGIPQAGIPIAEEYGRITKIPYRNVFEKAESGSGRKIIAAPQRFHGGRRLLILDDLITEADTKFEAAEAAEAVAYEVAGFGVLVDRQQGGKELLEAKGFKVAAPILISQAFEYYYQTGKASLEQYARSMDYLNQARSSAGLSKIIL